MKWCVKYVQETQWGVNGGLKTHRGYEAYVWPNEYTVDQNPAYAKIFSDINEAYHFCAKCGQGHIWYHIVEEYPL